MAEQHNSNQLHERAIMSRAAVTGMRNESDDDEGAFISLPQNPSDSRERNSGRQNRHPRVVNFFINQFRRFFCISLNMGGWISRVSTGEDTPRVTVNQSQYVLNVTGHRNNIVVVIGGPAQQGLEMALSAVRGMSQGASPHVPPTVNAASTSGSLAARGLGYGPSRNPPRDVTEGGGRGPGPTRSSRRSSLRLAREGSITQDMEQAETD